MEYKTKEKKRAEKNARKTFELSLNGTKKNGIMMIQRTNDYYWNKYTKRIKSTVEFIERKNDISRKRCSALHALPKRKSVYVPDTINMDVCFSERLAISRKFHAK